MKLPEDLKIKSLIFKDGECITVGEESLYMKDVKDLSVVFVDSIAIEMLDSNLGSVPWARVKYSDGDEFLFNTALIESIQINNTGK